MIKRVLTFAAAAAFAVAVASVPLSVPTSPAFAQAAKPAAAPKATLSFRDRLKRCSAEWKALKTAGNTQGQTWPRFWSACNKRLKTQAA